MRKSKQGYVHEHPFDATDVKDLPMAIANPISVFDNTNGRNDGQVILTELKKEDRNFIVAIQTENQNRKSGVVLKVNKIVTLFPKDARGVINWFNQGKATNIDKEKALHFIEALQNHSGTTITDEELKSAANIINSFETTKENGEKVDVDGTKFSLKDEEYLKAVEDGNMEKAQKMVNEAADAAGYSTDSSYQGTSAFNGAAPWGNGYFLTKDERKEAWDNGEFEGESTLGDYINDDIDGGNLEELTNAASYRAADPMRKEAIDNVRNAIQKKAKTITMYRSVPSDVKEGSFRMVTGLLQVVLMLLIMQNCMDGVTITTSSNKKFLLMMCGLMATILQNGAMVVRKIISMIQTSPIRTARTTKSCLMPLPMMIMVM